MSYRFSFVLLIMILTACASYDEAITRIHSGVSTPDTADKWKQLGFSLEEAKQWIEEGNRYNTTLSEPEIARALKDAGFTPQEATQWSSLGIGTAGDIKFKNSGMNLDEAKEWAMFLNMLMHQSGSVTYDLILKWRSVGFTASEAEQWSFFKSPEEAMEWRDTELGFRLSKGYKIYGIPPSLAVTYRDILNKECPEGKVVDWYEENAFDVKDKCFTYNGYQLTILERTKAIYRENSNIMFERFFGGTSGVSNNLPALIDFSSENASKHFTGFVKSIGVTNYEMEFGGKRVIPIFQPIVQFPR